MDDIPSEHKCSKCHKDMRILDTLGGCICNTTHPGAGQPVLKKKTDNDESWGDGGYIDVVRYIRDR